MEGLWKALLNAPLPTLLIVAGLVFLGIRIIGRMSGTLGCLGRNRIPLLIGGVAAVVSGGSVIAGVLTHVVPWILHRG